MVVARDRPTVSAGLSTKLVDISALAAYVCMLVPFSLVLIVS